MIEELISVVQAAEVLGVGASTVHYLIGEGRLAAYRHDASRRSALYLSRQQVEAFAATGWRLRPRKERP